MGRLSHFKTHPQPTLPLKGRDLSSVAHPHSSPLREIRVWQRFGVAGYARLCGRIPVERGPCFTLRHALPLKGKESYYGHGKSPCQRDPAPGALPKSAAYTASNARNACRGSGPSAAARQRLFEVRRLRHADDRAGHIRIGQHEAQGGLGTRAVSAAERGEHGTRTALLGRERRSPA